MAIGLSASTLGPSSWVCRITSAGSHPWEQRSWLVIQEIPRDVAKEKVGERRFPAEAATTQTVIWILSSSGPETTHVGIYLGFAGEGSYETQVYSNSVYVFIFWIGAPPQSQ